MNAPQLTSHRAVIAISIFAVFAVGLVALAAATGWEDVWAAVARVTLAQFAVLLILSLGNYAMRGLRWHLLVQALDIPATLLTNLRHYIGGFAMTVTPGRIGELIRLRWIWRETGRRPDSTASLVIADRAADLASVGIVLAIAVASSTAGLDGAWAAALIAIALAFAATRPALFHLGLTMAYRSLGILPRIFAGLRRASAGLTRFSRPTIAAPILLLSVIGWFCEGFSFWLLLGWLGADVSLPIAVAIFYVSMLTGGATGLPGGIGGAEAAMVAALALVGVPFEIALPATAIIRLTTLWFAILVGVATFPFAERAAASALPKPS